MRSASVDVLDETSRTLTGGQQEEGRLKEQFNKEEARLREQLNAEEARLQERLKAQGAAQQRLLEEKAVSLVACPPGAFRASSEHLPLSAADGSGAGPFPIQLFH